MINEILPKKKEKSISLVLGSGGARGLAHIGVIHWLEVNGFKIESISGCSIGALIGGIHAAGKLDEYERWVRAITRTDIVKLLDLSWGKSGLVKGDKIINTLTELVGDVVIEDLPIAFTAVATDILHGKEVWINSGNLFEAMQGTIARQKLAAYPAEHLIEIARNACGTLEFDRASEMIELGYNRAQKCLGRS